MKIITPADKLKEIASVLGLARCTNRLKNTIRPPMQVDNPAPILRANASPTVLPNCTMLSNKKRTKAVSNVNPDEKWLERCVRPISHSLIRTQFME